MSDECRTPSAALVEASFSIKRMWTVTSGNTRRRFKTLAGAVWFVERTVRGSTQLVSIQGVDWKIPRRKKRGGILVPGEKVQS